MAVSPYFSTVTLPRMERPYPLLLDFLAQRFPAVPRERWEQRLAAGKVQDEDGRPLPPDSSYVPLTRIHYFREVAAEPVIPWAEKIIFADDEILVACKPHFLPVIPAGPYVNECLLHRLKRKTGLSDLVPVNRIDRETAGLVLFSVNRHTRGRYHDLFMHGQVEKFYQAVAECRHPPAETEWLVENRLVEGEPWFRMQTAAGRANARSSIRLAEIREESALFLLQPLTGKKHQLRLHMSGLGYRIMNDRCYPDLLPIRADDFANPLQLVARLLRFQDPVTGKKMEFRSDRPLCWEENKVDTLLSFR